MEKMKNEYSLIRITGITASFIGILLLLFGNLKTPENFRILSDLIQNTLVLILVMLVFMPDNRQMKIAFYIGIFTLIYDFVVETIAVYLDWWYPLGGTQFPPLLVVPLEMVLSFFIIGINFAIVLRFPEKIRESELYILNWLKVLFKNPKFDWCWRLMLIVVNAILATFGDLTAGPEILVLGPNWPPVYTYIFNPWLWWGVMVLFLFRYLDKKIT